MRRKQKRLLALFLAFLMVFSMAGNMAPLTAKAAAAAALTPEQAIAVKNGDFSNGKNFWKCFAMEWDGVGANAVFTPTSEGLNIAIGNPGTIGWHVSLGQDIKLYKDVTYTASFRIKSSVTRDAWVGIEYENDPNWKMLDQTFSLNAGEDKELSYTFTASDDFAGEFIIRLGKNEGETYGGHDIQISDVRVEEAGYRDNIVLIDDGTFDDGLGSFTTGVTTGADASFSTVGGKVMAAITSQGQFADSILLEKSGMPLIAGYNYEVTFAGRGNVPANIGVQVAAGSHIYMNETVYIDDVTGEYKLSFTVDQNGLADIRFLLGNNGGSAGSHEVYLDNIRLDVTGALDALGIKEKECDILLPAPPVLSEDGVNNVVGRDVTLTFTDGTYQNAVKGVVVDGIPAGSNAFTVGNGTVTLSRDLFTEEKIYNIEVRANGYEAAKVKQQMYADNMWQLSWSDEFNGSSVDESKWIYQEGTGSQYGMTDWGNNEQQYYTRDNINVSNGTLEVKADNDGLGGKAYTSGRIATLGKFDKAYGKFEAKMKLPEGSGLWPAFWMIPADEEYGGWASSGEIDIMEARGRQIDRVDGTIHYGRTWPNNSASGGSYVFENGQDITGYHIYSLEWEPGEMRWYVDGQLYHTENNWFSQGVDTAAKYAYPAPFDKSFYMALNLAVGGKYDNNILPDDSIFPVYMDVDYVRVYDLVGREPIPAVEPVIEPEEIPADAKQPVNGNYVTDQTFSDVNTITESGTALDTVKWNFCTVPDFGGAASLTREVIDQQTFAKVNITNGGSEVHSVQLIQKVPVVKGRYYRLSFDAKAVDSRSMTIKIGGDENKNWNVYAGGFTADLNTAMKHYSYTFQMLKDTDIAARLEFNMGQSTSGVYLGNIVLEETDGLFDANAPKEPLKSGNQIYNGTFDQGDQSRMTFWNVTGASASVDSSGRELKISIPAAGSADSAAVYQKGMEYLKNDSYELTFDARAVAGRDITVKFTDKTGNVVYASRNVTIGTNNDNYKAVFTMPDVTDTEGQVIFEAGQSTADVYLDNVILKRTSYNNFDFTGIPMYPLRNGNFDAGFDGWTAYGASAAVENGEVKVNAGAGGNKWDKLISYDGLVLASGLEYTFSFDARASINTDVDITLENAYYTRIKEFTNIPVTNQMQHYEYTFRVDSTQTLALKYLFGGADQDYNFYLDNVVLAVKNAPLLEPAYLKAASNVSVIGEDVELEYYGTDSWAAADKILYVNRQEVPTDKISINNGRLIIDGSVFDDTGSVIIKAGALGYENTNAITLRILPLNGNLILNGDFESGLVGWGNYFHNGCASVQVNNDYMAQVTVNWHENGDWNAMILQEGIPLEAGKTYELTFDAYASVPRPIKATMKNTNMAGIVDLTETPDTYSIMFTPDSNMNAELQFLFGYVENGTLTTPGTSHNVYVGNICLRESNGVPAPVYPKVSGVKNGEVYKTAVTPAVKYQGEYNFTLSKKANKEDSYEIINYPALGTISEDGYYKLEVTDKLDAAVKTIVEFRIDTYVDLSKDYYIIKSRANSKVFEAAGTKNGASLIQSSYSEKLSQLFTMEEVEGGYYVFRSLTSGKVLEVAGGSMDNSASIQQFDYFGDKNQQWNVISVSQGYVKLVNRGSGKVIDIPGASGAEGLALKQYEDNGSNAQQWDVVKMDVSDILAGDVLPDTSTEQAWKQNAITYPMEGKLIPAGPIYLQWINTNSIGNVANYEIYVNGSLEGTVPANGDAVMEYEYYSTAVQKHTMQIAAVLQNGTRVESDVREFFVSKKGLGWGTLYRTEDMGLSWYYHWATDPSAGTDPDLQFVPMIWGNWGSAWLNNPENKKYKTVLGFNEPDFTEQSNVTPDEAIAAWPEFMAAGLRLGSPCTAIPAFWSEWFDEFMTKLDADPALDIDFIAIHCYQDTTDGQSFLKMIDDTWEKYHKPIWITEFGVAQWGEENAYKFNKEDVYNNFMSVVIPRLDARPYVERYAWFPFDPNDAYGGASGIFNYDTGELNELGLLYRSLGNPAGYELPELPGPGVTPTPTPEVTPTPTPEITPEPEVTPTPTPGGNPDPVVIHVEAEDYNAMEGVATEGCTEGGENAAYIDPGDWMEYSINVPQAGTYQLKVRSSNPYEETGIAAVQKNGQTLGSVNIAYTGGWQNWQDFIGDEITLDQGIQTIRIYIQGGRYNLNWFELTCAGQGEGPNPPISTPTPTPVPGGDPVVIRIEAEDYVAMEGVASENCNDEGGGQNIGWIDANDWMDYTVTIPSAGTYTIDYRAKGWNTDASIQLISNNEVLTTVNVFTDNAWLNKQSGEFTLPAGEMTLRVKAVQGGFNLNWFELTADGGQGTGGEDPIILPEQGNLALNKEAYASSMENGLTAENAFDGNGGTRWGSEWNDNQWIYVDLGAVKQVGKVVLNWEGAYGKAYKIQTSADGVIWTDRYTELNGDGGNDEITFGAVNVRYVKMLGMQRGTGYGYSLWDFEVYAQ